MKRRALATIVLGFATLSHADEILNVSCKDVAENLDGNASIEQQDCYDGVYWAQLTGCKTRPQWYKDQGLLNCDNASFRDFQCALFKMKGKEDPGNSHKCPRPCGNDFCSTVYAVMKDNGDIEVVDGAEPTLPPWLVGLLGVSGSGVLATIGYLYTKGGKGGEKKKKRALKKPQQSADVEESTETTALTQPQSFSAVAPPSPTVQHQYVAAYHPTLTLPHGGSFVAQAVPVTHVYQPVVAHHAVGTISAPPVHTVVNQVPAAHTVVNQVPAAHTVVTNQVAPAQVAPAQVAPAITMVTPTVTHASASLSPSYRS